MSKTITIVTTGTYVYKDGEREKTAPAGTRLDLDEATAAELLLAGAARQPEPEPPATTKPVKAER